MYLEERQKLCTIVKSQFDRWLTNAAGGNVTVKVNEEHWIMTPTLMSQNKLCDLVPNNILVVDRDMNILEGDGKLTRETNMHMALYETDSRIKAVIHAHPKEMMVYAAMGVDMPLVCENVAKLGKTLECLEYAPATTVELAERVRDFAKRKVAEGAALPFGALLKGHGVILADKSLESCNDMLERLESNAYAYTQSSLLYANEVFVRETAEENFNSDE